MEKSIETKSEKARRASLARKVHRGGRPRVDDLPEASLKCFARDLEVIRNYASRRGCSIKQAINLFANALVNGAKIPARPELAPDGWKLIR